MSTSLNRAFTALRRARLSGSVSACFFLLTCLLILDGLQALMRSDFNRIDLPLGGQTPISGAMPQQAKSRADIVAIIEGLDGIDFVPLTDFRGHWFGAHMWRATLDAGKATKPGRGELTIVDMVPAKNTTTNATITVQNPNQIYSITLWPSEDAMRAAHFSLIHRLTGLSAFIWAGVSFVCAIGIAAWHVLLNQRAHRALAAEGLFVIHGLRKTDAGCQAIFSPGDRKDLQVGCSMLLLSPQGVELGMQGVLNECSPHKHSALFSPDGAALRYGWLLRYKPDARSVEHENIPA